MGTTFKTFLRCISFRLRRILHLYLSIPNVLSIGIRVDDCRKFHANCFGVIPVSCKVSAYTTLVDMLHHPLNNSPQMPLQHMLHLVLFFEITSNRVSSQPNHSHSPILCNPLTPPLATISNGTSYGCNNQLHF